MKKTKPTKLNNDNNDDDDDDDDDVMIIIIIIIVIIIIKTITLHNFLMKTNNASSNRYCPANYEDTNGPSGERRGN